MHLTRSRRIVVSTAMNADDLLMWHVILALCAGVTVSDARSVRELCHDGSWVSGVPRALRSAGLHIPDGSTVPDPLVVAVTGPAAELDWALGELRGTGAHVALIEYHRA